MDYVVEMMDIVKDFPGIRANDHVTLRVREGTIHALLGENGAGKSTLMNILFGLHHPDSGVIRVRGREVKVSNPNVATSLGIGMVHQHFKLVHNFTVADNIVMGSEPRRGPFLDIETARQKVARISREYGLEVDPDARIEDLSVGTQQRVEILKMLYRDARILIFDEPTAVLTPQEIEELMEIMRKLAGSGKTIILITHKLKEIKEVADECSVLRRGRLVATFPVSDVSEEEMAELMVGREVSFKVEKDAPRPGAPALEIREISVRNERGILAVEGLSLTVREGEILGLCGVDGNGQRELLYALAGLLPVESGRILLAGKDITREPTRRKLDAGLGFVPEDRQRHGLVLEFSVGENLVIHDYGRPPFSRYGILRYETIYEHAETLMSQFDVRAARGARTSAGELSGGNQQKAIIAREVHRSPRVLVVAQPTRGLDVGAIEYIHRRIVEERDKGRAILLISFDLDEILDLSDRIAVIYRGKIVAEVDAGETDENELGLLMAGSTAKGESA
ncbi:ABC transporter related protein [Spirochaeta thermophila DSM 6578]|uniref:ABC transporter related protein n=1 Tax=Winmispira thermophila (strain ATCC 700085 / DSM 6578 / Z-1203) TaxID=869211 RepID=G0GD28_WINT7|nr:ABC transporter related protein [Spirochaeta thermophila DSM 6578]